jgi:hypothetical protein
VRRSGWLTVLGAAAAGTYVAARARRHPARALTPPPEAADAGEQPAARVDRPAEAGPATPDGAASDVVTMVPVTMETAVARVSDAERNGSPPASPTDAVPAASPAQTVERAPVELPPAKRPTATTLAGLAGAAGLVAAVLAALALATALDGGEEQALAAEDRQALGLLSKPSTERIPLAGSDGRILLAVGSGSRAILVLRGLEPAPSGKAYEAWVLGPAGSTPLPAGVFSGSERSAPLSVPVEPGATVGVTIEDAVGADAPGQRLRFVARRPA